LCQVLIFAANEHGQAVVSIGCGGDAAYWFEDAEGDLAFVDEAREAG
jgi:hypothetical protein